MPIITRPSVFRNYINNTVFFFLLSCLPSSSGAYLDPCLPKECTEKGTHKEKQYSFLGTGEYLKCQKLILPLLNVTKPCPKKPCSFNSVYQPPIDYEKAEFYGFSEYWYSMHDVLRIGGQYSASNMKQAVEVSTGCMLNSCFKYNTILNPFRKVLYCF